MRLYTRQKNSSRILFFNVNGSGMGHMNRCLAYARRLRGTAEISFFSLASAIEIIEEMGFFAEYYVSHFWTCNNSYDWNCELATRLGMMLERVQPEVIVFDGTWPFQGFLAACTAYGKAKLVWSNRGLMKPGVKEISVDKSHFALIIHPGELGERFTESVLPCGTRQLSVPPVVLLDEQDLLSREEARKALNLNAQGKYVLFSLGPGNLKDMGGIGHALIARFRAEGFSPVWARAPISVQDMLLPPDVTPVSVYPLLRYLKAFDVFVGAAGYNTCCEVVLAQVPSLLIPNALLVDDQAARAHMVAAHAPAVVSACETPEEQDEAVARVLHLADVPRASCPPLLMNGADLAAKAIVKLADGSCTV